MLSGRIVRNVKFRTATRWFTCSNSACESKIDKNIVRDTTEAGKTQQVLGTPMHHVTDFDKWVLVWVKRYPSKADVPRLVTVDCIQGARSKGRIKGTNYILIFAVFGCIYAIISGKRQAAQGDSIVKQREKWYQEAIREK